MQQSVDVWSCVVFMRFDSCAVETSKAIPHMVPRPGTTSQRSGQDRTRDFLSDI